jgi:hypothetical protein
MTSQHLSDEAVAAFADGVLRGHARERAARHTETCTECGYAVQVQREAAWALRAAPAPALPTSLVDRLRMLPDTTPLTALPTVFDDDGTAMMMVAPMAALVPPQRQKREHRVNPMLTTAAVVALTGALTVGAVISRDDPSGEPGSGQVVRQFAPSNETPVRMISPVSLFRDGGH